VTVLQNVIPLMRKARLEKLLGCNDPTVAAAVEASNVMGMLERDSVPQLVSDIPVCFDSRVAQVCGR
jgi:hypothetical protein